MAKKAQTETKATKTTAKEAVTAAAKAVAAKKEDVKAAVTAKKEVAEPAAAVKKEETKTEAKPAVAKKKPGRKPGTKNSPTAKKPGRKPAKKPVEKIQEVFIEYGGDQFQTEKIVEQIHEVYRSEGHRVGAIKSLRVYIDPSERKAYYVINDNAEGKFVEF